jgi:glycosyltransferase involved in cell wall biosynthesis
MQQQPLPSDSIAMPASAARNGCYIYIAVPWSPAGGGMYKVADYLIRAQAETTPDHAAQLRPLDTRGPGKAWASMPVLAQAMWKIARGRFSGELAGVHVNMAERLSLFRKGMIVITCYLLGVPVVVHLHAQMQRFYRSLPSPLRAAVRWMFSLASSVVVIGSGPRRFVIDELGVPAKKVDIVINGVPGPAEAPVRDIAPGRTKHIAFVGRLCEPKGVADLLRALAKAPLDRDRLQVTLAGNGEIARYEAMARELGVDGFVEFAGWCDQDEVDALLARSDVLVLPSHDEVLPLVVLEALANRVAVICTPVGELPTVLDDGQTARIVPVGDVDALARALAEVLGNDELLVRLARNGRELYERQFSLQRFFTSVARVHQRHFGISGRLPASDAPHDSRQEIAQQETAQ